MSCDSSPPDFNSAVSALCSYGMRPYLLTGVLRHLLIAHFTNASAREEPELRNILWRDNETTGILIESARRWKPEMSGKRPALLVKRNSYRRQRFAVADRAGSTPTGDLKYETFWIGSHTIFCAVAHGEGAAAELLSAEVQRYLTGFETRIQKDLDLFRFIVSEVGPLGELEESKSHLVVPVSVDWAYRESFVLRQHARVLGQVKLSTILEA